MDLQGHRQGTHGSQILPSQQASLPPQHWNLMGRMIMWIWALALTITVTSVSASGYNLPTSTTPNHTPLLLDAGTGAGGYSGHSQEIFVSRATALLMEPTGLAAKQLLRMVHGITLLASITAE